MRFTKPPKTYDEQLDLLVERGLQVSDRPRAIHYLSHLNYYRLAAYWLPYEQDHTTHQFRPGTDFNHILEHYIFDRELRLLILDAIERVEVSLRTQWAYHLAHTHGTHAHLDPNLFKARWRHRDNVDSLKETVRRSSETFVRHFRRYDEDLPPVWVICEIMTFGQLSNWYANLRHGADRNAVAHMFNMDEVNLTSFLHHLSIVRNHCAHHSRLWNREFTFAWRLPNHRPGSLLPNFNRTDGKRIYNTLVMLAYMMDIINPGHHWKKRLGELFTRYPQVFERSMGFPADWRNRPIWAGRGV
ncbi:MAG: Abi family protein [Desulfuromonadaceae bacterium]|nr:Abi family protein [Desulfuromonadaceae bacterium]